MPYYSMMTPFNRKWFQKKVSDRFKMWLLSVSNGHIKRPMDEDIQSNVLEIVGSNIQSTYITCPADPAATLGIKLPFLVIIVKNLKKYFTFEIQILDDKNVRRRFRASNYQVCKSTKLMYCLQFICCFCSNKAVFFSCNCSSCWKSVAPRLYHWGLKEGLIY